MRATIIKLAIGVIGIVLLIQFGSIDLSVVAEAAEKPQLVALAFACLLATVPLAALRWWFLLKELGFTLGFRWTFRTTFISLFFHTFLPGAYGGDVVRLAIAYRATRSGLNRLTFSVLTDRLTGLVALLMLGLAMVPFLPVAYASRIGWVAALAVVAGVAGLALVMLAGNWLASMVGRLPAPVGPTLAHIIREMVGALGAYMARPWVLLLAVFISLVQYAFVINALLVLGEAMRFEGLATSGYVIAGVWSLVANALPITPGGLGVGEAAFAHVAQALAAPAAAGAAFGSVFLAMRVLSTLVGVIGVVPFLVNRMELRSGISAMQAADTPSLRGPTAE